MEMAGIIEIRDIKLELTIVAGYSSRVYLNNLMRITIFRISK